MNFPFHLRSFLALFLVALNACATRSAPVREYEWQFKYHAAQATSVHVKEPPVLVFLVDGLSVRTLQTAIQSGKVPHLQKFFLAQQNQLQLGRAVFPTLTYPNITSILTSQPVDRHPIIGNTVIAEENEITHFESIQSRSKLNQWIGPQTVFSRLSRMNRTSVSLDHYFYAGATTRQHDDLQSGVAYFNQDYAYIDTKAIDSLTRLITEVEAAQLPSLTFVHLIGVDALSHQYGPDSAEVQNYLVKLDRALSPLFTALTELEMKKTPLISILTSDHGFMTASQRADLEGWFRNNGSSKQVRVLNQGRLASLYFPESWTSNDRTSLLTRLSQQKSVAMTLQRTGNAIHIQSTSLHAQIRYVAGTCKDSEYRLSFSPSGSRPLTPAFCPEVWDRRQKELDLDLPPYFISLVSSYFYSPKRPHAIVLAADHTSFGSNLGDHGGITLEEQLVPVLLRNVLFQADRVNKADGPLPTHELLKFVAP